MERELEACRKELSHTQEDLQASNVLSSRLAAELQELRQQHAGLEAERWEGSILPPVFLLGSWGEHVVRWEGRACAPEFLG